MLNATDAEDHLNAIEKHLLAGSTPVEVMRHVAALREHLKPYADVVQQATKTSAQTKELLVSNDALCFAILAAGRKN